MNHDNPETQTQALIESQQQLISVFRTQAEMNQKLIDDMAGFKDYLQSHRNIFGETSDLLRSVQEAMRENLNIMTELTKSIEAVTKAVIENYAATHANNVHLERLLTKVETYFGTTGLDYDN